MNFWTRLRQRRRAPSQALSLTAAPHWDIRGAADYSQFFLELPTRFPTISLLGLAQGVWSPEVRAFLSAQSIVPDEAQVTRLPIEFERAYFLPINNRVMATLAEFNEHHASPEIAIHLIVIAGAVSLLEWYDAPDDPIAVSKNLDEAAIRAFAHALGGTYEAAEAGT